MGTVAVIKGDVVAEMLAALDRDDRGLTFLEGGGFVSFADLGRCTLELAARWAGLGLRHGDRVLLVVTDEKEFTLALLSAMRAGLVPVPVVPPFAFGGLDEYAQGLRRVAEAADAALCLAGTSISPFIGTVGLPCPDVTSADVYAAQPGAIAATTPDDPALMQFTSGSTGDPKGVVVSHRALIAHARSLAEALAIDGNVDRGVSWLPLYHDMGLIGKLVSAVFTQTPVWYVPPLHFIKDPVGFLRLMSEVRGTIAFFPNFAYGLLARRAEERSLAGLDLSAWRVAGCGAEPVQADTLRRFAAAYAGVGFSPRALVSCYGLAEATLAVSATTPGHGMTTVRVDAERLAAQGIAVVDAAADAAELVSCGPPMPGTHVKIVGEEGHALPDGSVGEITVAAGYLADGYFRDARQTAQAWRNGWLHTGDTGFLLDGELYVTGRIKDLIIINGRNHQPHDIERTAEGVAGVRPSNVVALAMENGDSQAVRLMLEAVAYPPPADLAARVARAVQAAAGVPVADVVIVRKGKLPKTSSGKPRRRHTAALFEAGGLTCWSDHRGEDQHLQ
jgi:fatty-acyl-CoA synthase